MKRNEKLEQQLIKLGQDIGLKNVTPLIIEYTDLYTTCLRYTGCDKQTANAYAVTFLKNKYKPIKPQEKFNTIDLDDVCLVNCNIQRYR